jgi:hypothetical protein
MLHEDSRNRVRVAKPFLQLTSNGKCHYQFDIGSWIVFDSLEEASEFIQNRLLILEPDKIEEPNGGSSTPRTPDSTTSKP